MNLSRLLKTFEKLKPTTFLLLGGIVLMASFVVFIYLSPKPGGEVGMYELECLMFFAIAAVMIVIDRVLIVYFNYSWISLFELIVLIIALFLFINSNKCVRIKFTSHKYTNYMILYSNKGLNKSKFVSDCMLDKVFYVKDTNIVEINEKSLNGFSIYAVIPHWSSYQIDKRTFKNKKLEMYLSPNIHWTEHQIDSLYNEVLSKIH